jgi:hypothetical protein
MVLVEHSTGAARGSGHRRRVYLRAQARYRRLSMQWLPER